MKIKLSKLTLIVSTVGMILVALVLTSTLNTSVEIKDIYGNREFLGNMSIVFQNRKSTFNTQEIIVNKDKIRTKNFVKEGSYTAKLTEENIENREIFNHTYKESLVFEDKNSAGTLNLDFSHEESAKANIELRDKKSKKIKSYMIDVKMDLPINKYDSYTCENLVIKEGDNLYLTVLCSPYDMAKNTEKADDKYYGYVYKDKTVLSLYKINLANESSTHMGSMEYECKDLNIQESSFTNGNKVYFTINVKNKEDDNYTTKLLEFDVKTKKAEIIDLGLTNDKVVNFGELKNNEVLLISTSKENQYEGMISHKIDVILLDLNSKKVKYTKTLDGKYFGTPYENQQIAMREDNKIYIISPEEDNKLDYDINHIKAFNIYVFDENSGEKLYHGTAEMNYNLASRVGLVKQ